MMKRGGLDRCLAKNQSHKSLFFFLRRPKPGAPFLFPAGTIHTPLLADMPVPSFTDDREDWSAHGGNAAAAGDPGSLRRATSFRDVRWPEEDTPREKIEGWWRGVKDRCVFFGRPRIFCVQAALRDPPALPPPFAPRFVSGDRLNR